MSRVLSFFRFFMSVAFMALCVQMQAATFTVSNLNNAGAGSLRQAITDANNAGNGPHLIDFSVSGVITITSHLPVVSVADVTIDGNNNITVSANGGDVSRYVFRANGNGDGATFRNIDIKNTGYEPFRFDGSPTDITIENVNWYHDTGNYLNYGVYYNGNANGLTIKNVVAKNQQNYGEVIRVTGSATNVTIDNLTFDNTFSNHHDRYVVLIGGAANNVEIKNCNWNLDRASATNDGDFGIYFDNTVTNCKISNVEILNCEIYPLYTRLAVNGLKISNFTTTNGDGYGRAYGMRFNNTVTDLEMDTILLDLDHTGSADDGDYGIYFNSTTNNVNIDSLVIHDAEAYGIYHAGNATDITLNKVVIDNFDGWTGFTGIRYNSGAHQISMNDVTIDGDMNGTTNDGDEGIWFNSDNTADVSLINVHVNEFDIDGIRFYDIDNLTIDSCSFTNNYDGLEFYNNDARTNLEIENSTFDNNSRTGLVLNVANATTDLNFHDNIVSNNQYGIWLHNSGGVKDIQITNNEIFNNSVAGIYNVRADGVLYSENSIYNNTIGIDNVGNDGNNGLENASNEIPFLTGSEHIGGGVYDVTFVLPALCNAGDCDVEFYTNDEADLLLNGRTYVSTTTGLGSGTHTLSLNSGGNTEGFWTATLKVSSLNNSVSEFSNKQLIRPKAPAGVSNGIALWMDASDGITEQNGNDIIEWKDRSGNHTPSFYNSDPDRLETADDLVNFNPVVLFDNNDYIRWDGDNFTSGYTAAEVFMLGKEASPATADHGHLFDFGGGSGSHYSYSNQYIYEDFGSSDRKVWQPHTGTLSYSEGTANGASISGPNRKTTDYHIYNVLSETNNWQAAFDGITAVTDVSNTVNFSFGNAPHIGARYSEVSNGGRLPEIILYSRVLDLDERQRVNSYLAIRYGIELGHNYYASDWDGTTGTTFWALGGGYDSDIAGIARDDDGFLLQLQSKSINDDALVAMYNDDQLAGLPIANKDNLDTLSTDKTALLWGNNDLSTDIAVPYTPNTFTPPPTAPFYHMNRIWNVQETGTVGIVTVAVPQYLNLDYMLVHNTASFGTGTPAEVALTDDGNGNLIATYNFSDGDYFTFGAMRGAPGCVAANLDVWLKANAGVYTHNDTLTWRDQSGVDKHFDQAVANKQPVWSAGADRMNFNATLEFDGSNDNFTQANTWAIDDDATIYVVALGENHSGWRSLYDVDNDDFTLFNRNSPHDVGFWNYGSSPDQSGNSNVLPILNTAHIYGGSWVNATPNGVSVISNGDKQTTNMEMTNTISPNGIVSLGSGANRYWWDGLISEVIVYKRELTATEHEKVESYLAIKYGITLDQTVASTNYIDGAANVIWTAGNGYDNDIAGIAKDNCQDLHQKQSKSVNADALVAIYNGDNMAGLPVSNTANINSIVDDKSFMIWGNNDSTTNYSILYTPSTFTSPPPSAFYYMKRIWHVQETGTVGTTTVAIPTTTRVDYMLVHNSDDFSTGSPAEVALTDDGNGNLIATYNFSDGDYFTFGAHTKAPGCVANGLRLWLDGDYGYEAITNGVKWNDQTNNDLDVAQTVDGREATYQPLADVPHNFHPHMSFDGGDVFETDAQVLQSATSSGSVFFVAAYNDFGGYDSPVDFQADNPHLGRQSGNAGMWMNGSSPGPAFFPGALGLTQSQNQISGFEWTGGTNGGAEVRLDGDSVVSPNMDFTTVGYTSNFGVGGYISGAEGINGSMNEVIVYERDLTVTETHKVETYLAVKYGITVSHDYITGAGTVLWDSSAMDIYHNNIGAIARDDCGGLHQKQSKSVNAGSIPIIYHGDHLGGLPSSTASNAANITVDASAMLWGSTDSSTTYTEVYPQNTYIKHMKRTWKIAETGTIGTVTVYADEPEAQVMLVDADGDFSDGNTTLVALDNQSAVYDFADGDYFTFATLECKEVNTIACATTYGLDLTAFVSAYVDGGIWTETSTVLSGNNLLDPTSVPFDTVALGNYSFQYIGPNFSCDVVNVERLVNIPAPVIADITICEGGSTEIIIPTPLDREEVVYEESFNGSNGAYILRSKCTTPDNSSCYTDDAIDLSNRGLNLDPGTDFSQWSRWWHTWVYDVNNLRFGRLRDTEVSVSTDGYTLLPGEIMTLSGQSRRYWGTLEANDYVKFFIVIDGVEQEFDSREGNISKSLSTSIYTHENTTASPQTIKMRIKVKNSWGEGHIIDNLKMSKILAPPVFTFYSDVALTNELHTGLTYDPMTAAGTTETIYVSRTENGCESSADAVVVTVSENIAEAMSGENIFFCTGTTVDFTAAIANYQPGGIWSDDDATGLSLAVPTAVNLNALADGSYNFTYTLNGISPCEGEEAVITVNVGLSPEPPLVETNTIDVCDGESTEIIIPPDPEVEETLYEQTFDGSNGDYILWGRCTGSDSTTCRTEDVADLANRGLHLEAGTDYAKWTRWATYLYDVNRLLFGRMMDEEMVLSTDSFVLLPGEIATFSGQSARYFGVLEAGDYVKFFYVIDGVETEFDSREGHIGTNLFTSQGVYENTGVNPEFIQLRVKVKNSWGEGHIVDNLKISKALNKPTYTYYSDAGLTTQVGTGYSYDPGTTVGNTETIYVTSTYNGCESIATEVEVTVSANNITSMTGGELFYCGGGANLDLTAAITNFQVGGTWTDVDLSGVNLGDDTDVDVSSLSAGSYSFLYTLAGDCSDETAEVMVHIGLIGGLPYVVPDGTTSTVLTECVENDWIYFLDPNDDAQRVLAIYRNSNSIDPSAFTVILDVDAPAGDLERAAGTGSTGKAVELMRRQIQINCPTCGTLSPTVDVRIYWDAAEKSAAETLMDALMTANGITGTKSWEWYKVRHNIVDIPANFTPDGIFDSIGFAGMPDVSGVESNGVDYVQFNGVSTFSTFGAGWFVNQPDNTILPVEMLGLKASVIDNEYIRLIWSTASEVNNNGFEIQRSRNGVDFVSIGWVDGNGSTTDISNYSYKDIDVSAPDPYYYRLRQVDFDGDYSYSHIVTAALKSDVNDRFDVLLIPNPAKGFGEIQINTRFEEEVEIFIYDNMGKLITSKSTNLVMGDNTVAINQKGYAAGVYHVAIRGKYGSPTMLKWIIVE